MWVVLLLSTLRMEKTMTKSDSPVKIGDPIQVYFAEYFDGEVWRGWRDATVCVNEDDQGAVGAAFSDGTRRMVINTPGNKNWRKRL